MKDLKLILEDWRGYRKKIQEQVPGADPEDPAPEVEAHAQEETGGLPPITDQTSFAIFKGNPKLAVQMMNELLKGGEYFKQLQAAQLGKWYTVKTPEHLNKWVEDIGGVEVFAQRAADVGGKIPEKGLPKSKMPFLPGPPDATGDVADVEDALTPGGKYNVDMMEKQEPPAVNTFVGMDAEGAEDFMTAGLNDGNPNDDNIKIELGGGFAAADGIPTQTNILLPKGLGMAVKGIVGGDLDAYASLKGQILDGHHRWAATMLNDPSANIGTVARIDLDTLGTEETLRYLTAIGNALGNKAKIKEGRSHRETKISETHMRKRVRKMLRSKTKVSEVQIRETVRKMFTGE